MAVDIFNKPKSIMLNTTSLTAAATGTSSVLDLSGHDAVVIDVIATTADVVSDSPTVLKLQEADVTNSSSFADIPAFVGGGASGFTIPPGVTATGTQVYIEFNIDCRPRKRYLRFVVSPATTQSYTAIATFGRNIVSPIVAGANWANAVVTG